MKKIKIKFIDFWDSFNPKAYRLYKILEKYYEIEISDSPDFLFYSCFGIQHREYRNCVKIFWTGENIIPNFNECDYAMGFDDIIFHDRYLKLGYYAKLNRYNESNDLLNRKFCNFIYSNADIGEGAKLRKEFFLKLSEYKHIDAPGKICNNMVTPDLEPRDGDWYTSKSKFIENYKFTIAFENSQSNGYITEKFFQPIQANSIPIYWGAPDIGKDFNTKAFINCSDYKNFDDVIEKIKYLDNNDEAYLAMLKEPIENNDSRFRNLDKRLEEFLINIIEKGNKPFNKDPVGLYESYLNMIIDSKLKNNLANKKNKRITEKIFSVLNEYKNGEKRKVLTFLGIRMKFKINL